MVFRRYFKYYESFYVPPEAGFIEKQFPSTPMLKSLVSLILVIQSFKKDGEFKRKSCSDLFKAPICVSLEACFSDEQVGGQSQFKLIWSHPIGHHEDIVKVGGAYSDIPL